MSNGGGAAEYSAQIQGFHSLHSFQDALESVHVKSPKNPSPSQSPSSNISPGTGIITAEEVRDFVYGKAEAALAAVNASQNQKSDASSSSSSGAVASEFTLQPHMDAEAVVAAATGNVARRSGLSSKQNSRRSEIHSWHEPASHELDSMVGMLQPALAASMTTARTSPGLARRVRSSKSLSGDEDGDAIANTDNNHLHPPTSGSYGNILLSASGSSVDSMSAPDLQYRPRRQEVENEYNYIKNFRYNQGDSYVGMRLAYSSSSDSVNSSSILAKRSPAGSLEESREASPEKPFLCAPRMAHLNEETLTEIPLSAEPSPPIYVDSMLPESLQQLGAGITHHQALQHLTESEPALRVSVDALSATGFMPSVEDGLSSGGSDLESPSSSPRPQRKNPPQPRDVLRTRHKVAATCHTSSSTLQHSGREGSNVSNSSAGSAEGLLNRNLMRAITDDIRDIKRAILDNTDLPSVTTRSPERVQEQEVEEAQVNGRSPNGVRKSRSLHLGQAQGVTSPTQSQASPGAVVGPNDPIWIKRDSPVYRTSQHGVNNLNNHDNHHASSNVNTSLDIEQQQQHNSHQPLHLDQRRVPDQEYESDEDTEHLLTKQYGGPGGSCSTAGGVSAPNMDIPELEKERETQQARRRKGREVAVRHPDHPTVLIEGVLFRAAYLGSTQLVSEGQPSKATRMMQAQEAVGRIKAPEGEHQPSVAVDLFISTEKIMVLNTNLQEIMMDHSLKTISYIADISDILVVMARRRFLSSPSDDQGAPSSPGHSSRRQTKIVCHVFESEEATLIAQSIGHAFQVAYMEFLRANGIEDPGLQLKDMDYQDVLNQQEIFGQELMLFSDKQMQKEVIVPKGRHEPLGVVIVESGWGSMVPTVVLANMNPSGPAARCGQLNIGDQIISVNGVSCVGLPLAQCQTLLKNCKSQTAVKLTIVSCPPVVEVLIKRPDVKYQLGFSVQNGVICSLLRGGIAERGGVRVGHRIIEINGHSVVAVPHDRIVNMLATSIGEIHMKTMPTSIFRLLTGQEVPHYI